jgi:transcriptional regulator with XRE-family HTH domain
MSGHHVARMFSSARGKLKITIAQVAQIAGVSHSLISRVEQGGHIGITPFARLVIALRIDPKRALETALKDDLPESGRGEHMKDNLQLELGDE